MCVDVLKLSPILFNDTKPSTSPFCHRGCWVENPAKNWGRKIFTQTLVEKKLAKTNSLSQQRSGWNYLT